MRDHRPSNYNFRLNRYSSHESVHVHPQQCSIYLLQLGLHHRQFSLSVIFQVHGFPNCIHWFIGQVTFVVCILFSHAVAAKSAAKNVFFFYRRIICLQFLQLAPSTKE